ncbi:MAG: sirohydrochlorin chelatase [Sandaracinaceae bacterium]
MRAILLIDHGSRREAANRLVEWVAEQVRASEPDAHVAIAHLELAPPTIAEGYDACIAAGANEIVVVPFFLASGRHTERDVPAAVSAAAARHAGTTYRITPPLGPDAKLVDIVLARIA